MRHVENASSYVNLLIISVDIHVDLYFKIQQQFTKTIVHVLIKFCRASSKVTVLNISLLSSFICTNNMVIRSMSNGSQLKTTEQIYLRNLYHLHCIRSILMALAYVDFPTYSTLKDQIRVHRTQLISH